MIATCLEDLLLAHVDADRGIELERVAAARDLGIPENQANLHKGLHKQPARVTNLKTLNHVAPTPVATPPVLKTQAPHESAQAMSVNAPTNTIQRNVRSGIDTYLMWLNA